MHFQKHCNIGKKKKKNKGRGDFRTMKKGKKEI